jgi:hypothetical protein
VLTTKHTKITKNFREYFSRKGAKLAKKPWSPGTTVGWGERSEPQHRYLIVARLLGFAPLTPTLYVVEQKAVFFARFAPLREKRSSYLFVAFVAFVAFVRFVVQRVPDHWRSPAQGNTLRETLTANRLQLITHRHRP